MKRCIRPLIGKIPLEILKKYGDIIAERMNEYATNTAWFTVTIMLFWATIIWYIFGRR